MCSRSEMMCRCLYPVSSVSLKAWSLMLVLLIPRFFPLQWNPIPPTLLSTPPASLPTLSPFQAGDWLILRNNPDKCMGLKPIHVCVWLVDDVPSGSCSLNWLCSNQSSWLSESLRSPALKMYSLLAIVLSVEHQRTERLMVEVGGRAGWWERNLWYFLIWPFPSNSMFFCFLMVYGFPLFYL